MHFIFRYTTMLKKFIYTSLMTLVLASCSESVMDDINKDEANPPVDIVDAKFQLTDAIVSTAFTTYGGPYAWYVSSYTEQSFGTGNNQLMKTELRQRTETAGSSSDRRPLRRRGQYQIHSRKMCRGRRKRRTERYRRHGAGSLVP